MNKILFLLTVFFLTSCTNDTQDELSNNGQDNIEAPDSSISDEQPRLFKEIEHVGYDESHEEAEFLQEADFVDPENINFELLVENTIEDGIADKQLLLIIQTEGDKELVIGSIHFRLERYDQGEWIQIENVPYGAEDAQVIISPEESYERTFSNIDHFETDFENGIYRFVNAGYVFPFYVYILE